LEQLLIDSGLKKDLKIPFIEILEKKIKPARQSKKSKDKSRSGLSFLQAIENYKPMVLAFLRDKLPFVYPSPFHSKNAWIKIFKKK
jgi:hypothetical protein